MILSCFSLISEFREHQKQLVPDLLSYYYVLLCYEVNDCLSIWCVWANRGTYNLSRCHCRKKQYCKMSLITTSVVKLSFHFELFPLSLIHHLQINISPHNWLNILSETEGFCVPGATHNWVTESLSTVFSSALQITTNHGAILHGKNGLQGSAIKP